VAKTGACPDLPAACSPPARQRACSPARLLALTTAVTLAVPGPPAYAGVVDPCPPLTHAVEGRGLDGGVGCVPDREVEGPTAKLSATTTGDLARQGTSGVDRLRAVEQTRALRAAAEARRAADVSRDFTTAAGPVPANTAPWRSIGPNPLNFDEPGYPSGAAGLGRGAGRVSSIAIDHTGSTGRTLYVGAAAGGVWKSTDAGATWTRSSTTTPACPSATSPWRPAAAGSTSGRGRSPRARTTTPGWASTGPRTAARPGSATPRSPPTR